MVFTQFSEVLYYFNTSDFSTLTNTFFNFPTVSDPIKQTALYSWEGVQTSSHQLVAQLRCREIKGKSYIQWGTEHNQFSERLTCKSFRNLCFKRMSYFTVHIAKNREPVRLNQISHSSSVLHINKFGMFKLINKL